MIHGSSSLSRFYVFCSVQYLTSGHHNSEFCLPLSGHFYLNYPLPMPKLEDCNCTATPHCLLKVSVIKIIASTTTNWQCTVGPLDLSSALSTTPTPWYYIIIKATSITFVTYRTDGLGVRRLQGLRRRAPLGEGDLEIIKWQFVLLHGADEKRRLL